MTKKKIATFTRVTDYQQEFEICLNDIWDDYIADQEKAWMNQIQEMGVEEKFWLLFSGGKWAYTAKWWNPEEYQKVVDHFKDKILFVQCGELSHHHPQLH